MCSEHVPYAMTADNDLSFVHAARQGDTDAFEEIVKRHTTRLFRVAQNIVHCREDAEDVVQDTFLRAFQHLHDFEERSRFSTWLITIAVNVALMKVRCSRRLSTTSMDEDRDEMFNLRDRIADWRPNPEQLYSSTELQDILQRGLSSLPHGYKLVFILRDIEGVSIAEIAPILGLTVSNTKVRLTRARLKLREHLSQYFARARNTTEESSWPQKIRLFGLHSRYQTAAHAFRRQRLNICMGSPLSQRYCNSRAV